MLDYIENYLEIRKNELLIVQWGEQANGCLNTAMRGCSVSHQKEKKKEQSGVNHPQSNVINIVLDEREVLYLASIIKTGLTP